MAAAWNVRLKNPKCLNVADVFFANSAFAIASDLAVWILPMPVVHTLRLPPRKKLVLYFLFSTGSVVIAIAAARVPKLDRLVSSTDQTFDFVDIVIYSSVEITLLHICAGLPAVLGLITRLRNQPETITDTYNSPGYSGNTKSSAITAESKSMMTPDPRSPTSLGESPASLVGVHNYGETSKLLKSPAKVHAASDTPLKRQYDVLMDRQWERQVQQYAQEREEKRLSAV